MRSGPAHERTRALPRLTLDDVRRFLGYVDRSGSCWEWRAAIRFGYGTRQRWRLVAEEAGIDVGDEDEDDVLAPLRRWRSG